MKVLKLFKTTTRVITTFVPNALLAKIASEVAIWAVESLVKNTKTTVDDKGLEIVKKVVKENKEVNKNTRGL